MNACHQAFDLQSYIDGELPEAERYRLERHMDQCVSCAMELALLRRVVASLEAMPLLEPGAGLTERVLDRVVPARVRRRWMRVIGWSYAAAFAAFIAIATLWIAQPATQAMLGSISGAASIRLTGLLVFALDALAFAAGTVAGGWGLVLAALDWLAPLGRAFAPWIAHPSVRVAVPAAALASAAVVWWLRAREARHAEGNRHVAVLGV
jgi:anti-sigma factor RsiW